MERDGLVRRSRGALTLADVPRLIALVRVETGALD